MRRTATLVALLLCSVPAALGTEVPFDPAAAIDTSAMAAHDVAVADIDGDGDLDAVSASFSDNKIAWYENDDGAGTTWTARTISTSVTDARSVFTADVDSDGDVDVLAASQSNDEILWFENDGATPPTWTSRSITTSADGAYAVFAADVDSDGDIDALSASRNDDKIAWYENDGGSPPTWTARTISLNADDAYSVFAIDVDRDGDVDVLSASQARRQDRLVRERRRDPSIVDRTRDLRRPGQPSLGVRRRRRR